MFCWCSKWIYDVCRSLMIAFLLQYHTHGVREDENQLEAIKVHSIRIFIRTSYTRSLPTHARHTRRPEHKSQLLVFTTETCTVSVAVKLHGCVYSFHALRVWFDDNQMFEVISANECWIMWEQIFGGTASFERRPRLESWIDWLLIVRVFENLTEFQCLNYEICWFSSASRRIFKQLNASQESCFELAMLWLRLQFSRNAISRRITTNKKKINLKCYWKFLNSLS
jgi:hypothetical protein